MKKGLVWLVFDLGVQGDYEGLYAWLDQRKAKECGDGAAYFNFQYSQDLAKELREDLAKSITLTTKTRLYAIHPKPDGKVIGHFICGNRKGSPWAGFAPQGGGEPDVADG